MDKKIEDRIEVIKKMENIHDTHKNLLDNLNKSLDEFEENIKEYAKLRDYYIYEYMDDVDLDNDGAFPKDLNRGILSEDAVYNLMGEEYELGLRLVELGALVLREH